MFVAVRSFVATYDGRQVAVHAGRTRVTGDHELARRYPLRFEPVRMREEAASRFRHLLDQTTSYTEYRTMLNTLTARLKTVERQKSEM